MLNNDRRRSRIPDCRAVRLWLRQFKSSCDEQVLRLRASVVQQPCRCFAAATNAFAFHVVAAPQGGCRDGFGTPQARRRHHARTGFVRRGPLMHNEVADPLQNLNGREFPPFAPRSRAQVAIAARFRCLESNPGDTITMSWLE